MWIAILEAAAEPARGRWAGLLWSDPTLWLPSARALANSSRGLRELLGRWVYGAW